MTLTLRLAAPIVAAALALTGCASAGATAPAETSDAPSTVTVEHAQGSTEVTADPSKVVVLDYTTLDTLQALGLSDLVVGTPKATLPPSLDEFDTDAVTDVGTLQEPNLEVIAALGADLVIVGGRSAAKYPDVAGVAPTVDLTVNTANPIESLTERATALGELFGAEQTAQEKLSALNASIEETKPAAANSGEALIVLTSGGKASAFGPGARFGGLIHDVLGVPAASTDLQADNHGQAISFEFIAETNPDRLFVVDRDAAIGQEGQAAQQVLDNALVQSTTAWRNGAVTYLDGADWYLIGNGLGSTQRMVDAVADAVSA